MTEKELRERAVSAARAWLGKKEADGGHREILAVYNAIRPLPAGYAMKDTDPWCAAFVSAAAARAGLTEIVFPECSCPRMAALYRAAGRWEEVDFAVPKPGDVVFYSWSGGRAPEHVGLVERAEGDWLTVLEGNKADAVARRRIHLDSPYILGYGQPDYFRYADKAEAVGGGALDAPREQPAAAPLALPLLAEGCAGEAVRALQLLLIGRGCSCGGCGADGDFGPATRSGVLRFQRVRGLEADGLVGDATWAALLGVSA